MAGVTSVKMYVEQPSRMGPIIAMVIGGLFILGGIGSLFRGNPIAFVFGVALFLLGVWIFKKRVPIYRVLLHSASGEQRSNPSTSREFIEQVRFRRSPCDLNVHLVAQIGTNIEHSGPHG
jgi:hypothetical protein